MTKKYPNNSCNFYPFGVQNRMRGQHRPLVLFSYLLKLSKNIVLRIYD